MEARLCVGDLAFGFVEASQPSKKPFIRWFDSNELAEVQKRKPQTLTKQPPKPSLLPEAGQPPPVGTQSTGLGYLLCPHASSPAVPCLQCSSVSLSQASSLLLAMNQPHSAPQEAFCPEPGCFSCNYRILRSRSPTEELAESSGRHPRAEGLVRAVQRRVARTLGLGTCRETS